jgi:hypothetical protein
VVPWYTFVDLVHGNVNPLAGEEHMKELMQQLQLMGEVCVFLRSIFCYILELNWDNVLLIYCPCQAYVIFLPSTILMAVFSETAHHVLC